MAAALLATAIVLAVPSAANAAGLQQLPGTAGCTSHTGDDFGGPGLCQDGEALAGVRGVAVSPDGTSVYTAAQTSEAVAAFRRDPATGALTQLPGTAACTSHSGSSGACADGRALSGARSVIVSPDGHNVYVAAGSSGGVAAFARDAASGELTQLAGTDGCVQESYTARSSGQGCAALPSGVSMGGPYDLATSPDGTQIYVADYNGGGITVLTRAQDGALRFASCTGASSACEQQAARGLTGMRSITVSPDGRHAYTTASGYFGMTHHAVVTYERVAGGALQPVEGDAGCLSEDGKFGSHPCGTARALRDASDVEVSPDGAHAYVRAGDAIAVFARDPQNGALTQAEGEGGCLTSDDANRESTRPGCALASGLEPGNGTPFGALVATPDGQEVYAASSSGGVALFTRSDGTGLLGQAPGEAACIARPSDGPDCAPGAGLNQPQAITVSPDGEHVYVASQNGSAVAAFDRLFAPACEDGAHDVPHNGTVTVALRCTDADGDTLTRAIADGPAHGTLGEIDQEAGTVTYTPQRGYGGEDAFTFTASDGREDSAPATVTLTVAAPPPPPRGSLLRQLCRQLLGPSPTCDLLP